MQLNLLIVIILPVLGTCQPFVGHDILPKYSTNSPAANPYHTIGDVPAPAGFQRIETVPQSFAAWLRKVDLKKDKTVYLYNHKRKGNQSAQFAVLNVPVGDGDLQQCADAVMRLRAEYLYGQKRLSEIDFIDNNHRHYRCPADADRKQFDQYLNRIFAACGTLSLEKQLRLVHNVNDIKPGDVFIKGGSPGHAVIVMDVAVNNRGKKMFLLAQSYMPAQDVHVLLRPGSESSWYAAETGPLETPEWTFHSKQLKTW